MGQTTDREGVFLFWDSAYRGILYKIARSYAGSTTDRAELIQEMRCQLWNSTRAYTGTSKPSTWVYRVCLNTAMTWRRNALRRSAAINAESDLNIVPSLGSSPLETVAEQEVIQQLYAAIHKLSDSDKVLILLSLDGLSYRDIAEITGSSENHIGVGLTRARKRLTVQMK